MKPKVFLTGATGFFGSYLKKALIKNGYNLVCLTRKNAEDSNDKLITLSAKNEDFLAISETITMIIALIIVLNIKYIFLYDYLLQSK